MLAHKKSRSQRTETVSDLVRLFLQEHCSWLTAPDCTVLASLAALAPHPFNSGITDWATAQETVSETPSGSTQTKPHLYFWAVSF